MVSSSHEAMHRIFQEDPGVFSRTFRALGLPFDDPVAVTLLPTDRVDVLLRFDTAAPDSSFLLAVQAQAREDPAKPASWARDLAHLYVHYGLPPVLLVVCQNRKTATWAAEPTDFGTPGRPALTLRPLVLGPDHVPVVTDSATAVRDIPLATLSAITHGTDPDAESVLKALAAALKTVDEDTASIYIELTEQGLGAAPAADIWRDLMAVDLSFFRSETAQRLRGEGRAEGRAEDILLLLTTRGIEIPDDARDRITTCTDLDILRTWLTRAITATSAEELFTEPEAT